MELTTKIIILTIYLISMVIFYVFMCKRLSFLNKKHIKHTKVKGLSVNNKILIRYITIIWVIAMLISSILITKI